MGLERNFRCQNVIGEESDVPDSHVPGTVHMTVDP